MYKLNVEKVCRNLKAGIFLLVLFRLIVRVFLKIFRGYEEMVLEIEVLSLNCMRIRFPVVLDWRGIFFSRAVVLISGSVMIFSSFYIDHEVFPRRFVGLVILFVLSINFLIYVPNLLGLIIG